MNGSGRASKISSVIAALCILVYIAAIAFGAVQIILNIGERRDLAQEEFNDLMDRAASSAVFLKFMSPEYQEAIEDFLDSSRTPLLAVIITGSDGEYAFERYPDSGIVWVGDSPRFKTRIDFPGEPLSRAINIEGQRNGNIRAVFSYIDQGLFLRVLKNTLFAVLAALAAAFITLLVELSAKGKAGAKPEQKAADALTEKTPAPETPVAAETPVPADAPSSFLDDTFFSGEQGESGIPFDDIEFAGEDSEEQPEIPAENSEAQDGEVSAAGDLPPDEQPETKHPRGLFTPRGNVGWESYIHDRLASELHRCASFEQDLVLLAMEFRGGAAALSDDLYRVFTDEAVSFFTLRDLIFEAGENGISVIVPSVDLEQGMAKSEEFRNRIMAKIPQSFENRAGLCMGLSSRSGRLIDADRLILEASTALQKALDDPDSPIVAFKSDLEKYRDFIKRNDR